MIKNVSFQRGSPVLDLGTSLLAWLSLLLHPLRMLPARGVHAHLGVGEEWAEASEGRNPPGVPVVDLLTAGGH